MLGKPYAGWTKFQLGSEETQYSLSFLNDIANEWLTQAIHGLKTLDVFSVHGFCEPGRVICTVSYWSCYVIFEDDDRAPTCHGVNHLHVSMLDFCKKLHEDISGNLEDWVHWDDSMILDDLDEGEDEETAFDNRRAEIQQKLDELEALIKENEENFEGLFF